MKTLTLEEVLLSRIKTVVETKDKLYHENIQLRMKLSRAKSRITELEEIEWMYKDLCK